MQRFNSPAVLCRVQANAIYLSFFSFWLCENEHVHLCDFFSIYNKLESLQIFSALKIVLDKHVRSQPHLHPYYTLCVRVFVLFHFSIFVCFMILLLVNSFYWFERLPINECNHKIKRFPKYYTHHALLLLLVLFYFYRAFRLSIPYINFQTEKEPA